MTLWYLWMCRSFNSFECEPAAVIFGLFIFMFMDWELWGRWLAHRLI
jgi:hypothetical protein